ARSGEAERMQRQVAELQAAPTPCPPAADCPPPAGRDRANAHRTAVTRGGTQSDEQASQSEALLPLGTVEANPAPRHAAASEIELTDVEFAFDEPPQAGAHARLVIELH